MTQIRGTLRTGARIKKVSSPYSPEQIARWLDAIRYYEAMGTPYRDSGDGTADPTYTFPEANLDNLTILVRLHLVAFSFESTPIHYSSHHSMDVSPEGLYQRLVVERNGSYCYGKNGLLFGMLRGLGYRVYAGQARVNTNLMSPNPDAPPDYNQISHMVLFVQPLQDSNVTYLVDCGYAVGCLTRPILLSDDEDNIVAGATPSQKHRLQRGAHPDSSLVENPSTLTESWRLEVFHQKAGEENTKWRVIHTFSETEYFQKDFDAASFYVANHIRGSPFASQVICVRFFWMNPEDLDHKEDEGAESESEMIKGVSLKGKNISEMTIGYVSLLGTRLRWQKGTRTVALREVKTEKERVEVLRNVFGISIGEDGFEYVRGQVCALPLN